MIREPFEELQKLRENHPWFRVYDEGESAVTFRPIVADRARTLFEGHPDVKPDKVRGQFFLNYRGEVAIVPKKFRKRWRGTGLTFSSAETPQNKAYWRQRNLEGFPSIPRVIVGYQFIKEMTGIKVWVAYPNGKYCANPFLMPEQGVDEQFRVIVAEKVAESVEDKKAIVVPKKDVRKPS